MLSLRLSKVASSFLTTRPQKHQRQLAVKIQNLCYDSSPPDSVQLKGSTDGFRRTNVGEYRIIYRVEGETLFVALIGKRNDGEVYKRFGRK